MKLKSELADLISEYKKVKDIHNTSNLDIGHSDGFREWLSEVIMDTINYERLIAQILNDQYEVFGEVAEIESKPVLSCSEAITSESLSLMNYSNFVEYNGTSDLGANKIYQRNIKDLKKNIKNIQLLLMQSYESENMNIQISKLTRVKDLSSNHNIPFIVGCYGHQDNKFFQQKERLLLEFMDTLINQECDFYADSYNDVACRIIVPNKSKRLVKVYRPNR